MAKGSNPFERSVIKVEKRSPFDMSHSNFLTMSIGTLVPVMVERVMPNDTMSLGVNFRAQLPPLASNFFGNVKIRFNAFFVPNRLLYGAWKDYVLYAQNYATGFVPEGVQKFYIPRLSVLPSNASLFGPGTLADYLGVRGGLNIPSGASGTSLDVMPFLAYHRIWNDWFRVPAIQRDAFIPYPSSATVPDVKTLHKQGITALPSASYLVPTAQSSQSPQNWAFSDFVSITSLRQVNYDKDYFSTAFRNQAGGAAPMSVSLSGSLSNFQLLAGSYSTLGRDATFVDPNTGFLTVDNPAESNTWRFAVNGVPQSAFSGSFSIPQLRTANALQQFAENNALAGGRYKDAILANYGITPADALAEVPIYLGGFEETIYKNTVMATANSTSSNRGFGDVIGGTAASGYTSASNSMIDKFTVSEHGYIMVVADVVPDPIYSSGIRRYLRGEGVDISAVDYLCWPALCGAGNDPIYKYELSSDDADLPFTQVFGYSDKYASYKFHINEVHGEFSLGQSLDFMSIQRSFSNPQIGSDFLEVAKNSIDNVAAVSGQITNIGVMLDCGFSEHMIRPLPVYSIPTLCDDIHKDSVSVPRGGRRL